MCKEPFINEEIEDERLDLLHSLVFKDCPNCEQEFPELSLPYTEYCRHVTSECQSIKLACPFDCGQ